MRSTGFMERTMRFQRTQKRKCMEGKYHRKRGKKWQKENLSLRYKFLVQLANGTSSLPLSSICSSLT